MNHSRIFARALTKDIAATMDVDLKQALSRKLDCTNQRPPVGMVMDKMTPNKRTGEIHAIIIPVPSNPLSEVMLAPVMLEVPPVTHHDADGLAAMAKKVLNGAGVKDSQLEGVSWDGQYVRLGVMEKLIELLDIPGMDTDKKRMWITQMWEPAHNIELATKDIRDMTTVFDWFVEHISIVNGIIQTLNIGKGLEQCLTAAVEQNRRLYRLTNLSTTRFSAYFERSLSNFEKDFPIIVQALQTRSMECGEKDQREHASNWLKKILTKTFIMVNHGLIDIYRLLGTFSCLLQTVEQFPWTVEQRLRELIQCLRDMSAISLKSAEEDDEVTDVSADIDAKRWPTLSQYVNSVLSEQYHGLSTGLAEERRRGRFAANVGSNDLYTGIEDFLHFFLRCATKTHAEGVAESMGNYVEMHSDKRRGLDIGDVGLEARIHWNGPPIHHATRLGESALDRHFGGRRRWHFVTKNNRLESLVTKRLKKEKPRLPFY